MFMSNVIKLNNAKKLNVQLLDDISRQNLHVPSPEEVMRKKMEQSFQEGYAQGREEAERELKAHYENELLTAYSTVREIAENVENKLKVIERNFGENIFYLSLKIAEKIIRQNIELKTNIVENLKTALNQVVGASQINVRINSGELNYIKENISSDSSLPLSKIKFEEDPGIQKGECVVESEIGNVDLRVKSQLEELQKHFETFFDEK